MKMKKLLIIIFIAGETNWSTIKGDSLFIGASKQAYLNTGDPNGTDWIVGECDVSIRPGWFYHHAQDDQVKSLDDLRNIYYGSVGRNGVLLLNIPPDKRGLIHENDVQRLKEFSAFLKETFDENLALGQRVISFTVEAIHDDHWHIIAEGTTIGYKRILKVQKTKTNKLRLNILEAKSCSLIASFELFEEADISFNIN